MSKFICSCGKKVDVILYKDGKKFCNDCKPRKLSGLWERNNAMERSKYKKDILQPGQPGYEEVYGNLKTKKSN